MALIDAAVVLYCGFLVLFIWRWLIWWDGCGRNPCRFNYVTWGLVLITVILGYDSYYFIEVAITDRGSSAWDSMPAWLRPWMMACPVICLATLMAAAFQSFQHVERIHSEKCRPPTRHDRAIQIILLPAVYSIMAMSSMTRMYSYVGSQKHPYSSENKEMLNRSLSRSETCFWVGDLYEAWALCQFGWLVLEVIDGKIVEQEESRITAEVQAACGLRASHKLVSRLVWLGIMAFLVVCIAEAGWSLWLLTFDTSMSAEGFDASMSKFVVAGFLASGVAIYNVYLVQGSYAKQFESFNPWMKFITVKILVTFAFMQRGLFKIWAWSGTMMSSSLRKTVDKIPFFGEVIDMPAAQFEMFYASLIITECLLVGIAHYWAWNDAESWYGDTPGRDGKDEGVDEGFGLTQTSGAREGYGSNKF